jgi:hypothetical protein
VTGALGAVQPFSGVPARRPVGDPNHQPDRFDERPAAQSHPHRGQLPSGQAARKVPYLAVRNLEEFRRPNAGIRSSGWNRRCRRSRSTSTGGSRPHENRHDHLHRWSDAPPPVTRVGRWLPMRSGRLISAWYPGDWCACRAWGGQ